MKTKTKKKVPRVYRLFPMVKSKSKQGYDVLDSLPGGMLPNYMIGRVYNVMNGNHGPFALAMTHNGVVSFSLFGVDPSYANPAWKFEKNPKIGMLVVLEEFHSRRTSNERIIANQVTPLELGKYEKTKTVEQGKSMKQIAVIRLLGSGFVEIPIKNGREETRPNKKISKIFEKTFCRLEGVTYDGEVRAERFVITQLARDFIAKYETIDFTLEKLTDEFFNERSRNHAKQKTTNEGYFN